MVLDSIASVVEKLILCLCKMGFIGINSAETLTRWRNDEIESRLSKLDADISIALETVPKRSRPILTSGLNGRLGMRRVSTLTCHRFLRNERLWTCS